MNYSILAPERLLALLLVFSSPMDLCASPIGATRIDPRLEIWPTLQSMRGEAPLSALPALIVFGAPPAERTLEILEHQGVRFSRSGDGRRRRLGRIYPARLAHGAVAALRREPSVQRVDLDHPLLPRVRPLERTAPEIQATQVWSGTLATGINEDGQGMVIGNLDGGIDVFHPAFFRADGPIHSWIDADDDGIFQPGVDGVDLDGDGQLDDVEKLRFFDARAWGLSKTTLVGDSANGRYDPAFDYLYIDQNGDGQRNFGPSFGDATPAFGEPLLVADDVNGNGRLDLHEKVRLLDSSKIRAVWVNGAVYERGVNLSATPNEGSGSAHGTATSGILVGGQRGYTARVGIAPGADLVLVVDDSYVGDGLLWLVQEQSVDVVLHEYSAWTGRPVDGSSAMEELMDEAAALGVSQVVPAGNLHGTRHTALVTIPAGGSTTLSINLPGDAARHGPVSAVEISMHWRNPANGLSFSLRDPAGTSHALTADGGTKKSWDERTSFWSLRDDSSRGTARFDVNLRGSDGANSVALSAGQWTLTLRNEASHAEEVHAYIADNIYGWGAGAVFTTTTPAASTVCWPATADSAITVAAYAGRTDAGFGYPAFPEQEGQLRSSSSRGTRIDGRALVDVAAPDNPLAPISAFSMPASGIDIGHGNYWVFGGTSGSAPHVAGAVALLVQHAPELNAEQVRQRLHQGALVDQEVSAGPAEGWGAGKLRIFDAIHQGELAPSTPPQIAIDVPGQVYTHRPAEITVHVRDAEDAPGVLEVRWDADYDGHWDTPFAAAAPLRKTFAQVGEHLLKAQVRDSSGLTAETLAAIVVLDSGDPPPDASLSDGGAPPTDAENGGGRSEDGGCRVAAGQGSSTLLILGLALLLVGRIRKLRRRA